ncbi:MAG TPA: GxxExxY protein [Anaerolineales bacterium]|jgi:GxxExxY protein
MDANKMLAKRFKPIPLEVEAIGKKILDAAYTVHTALGPGLLDSVYEACTAYESRRKGLELETLVIVPVKYQTVLIETGLRLDLWAEKLVIVEFKSVETMHPLYEAQLLTYLKITGCRLGYLINFNVKHLKDGIKRMVL